MTQNLVLLLEGFFFNSGVFLPSLAKLGGEGGWGWGINKLPPRGAFE